MLRSCRQASCGRYLEEIACHAAEAQECHKLKVSRGGQSSGEILRYAWMKHCLVITIRNGCVERRQETRTVPTVLDCCRGKKRWGSRRVQTSASFPAFSPRWEISLHHLKMKLWIVWMKEVKSLAVKGVFLSFHLESKETVGETEYRELNLTNFLRIVLCYAGKWKELYCLLKWLVLNF